MEIAAAGRPAILVPYPHATADHQTTNARWMADGGAAVVIPDAELTAERLSATIAELLADEDRLREMSIAARRLAKPDAAERIAGEVLRAAGMAEPMRGRRLHFIAIGGAGMSGLALVCRQLGAEVSGSDRAESSYMERLRAAGIEPAPRPRRRARCRPTRTWWSPRRSPRTTPSWRGPASAASA